MRPCLLALPALRLILSVGTCKKWRSIILDDPAAPITGPRRTLLKLFLYVIDQPKFLSKRDNNLVGLEPFNRQGYLDRLLHIYKAWLKENRSVKDPIPVLPPIYSTYILEWPEKAIVGRLWPGLQSSTLDRSYLPHPTVSSTTVSFAVPSGKRWFDDEAKNPDATPFQLPLLPIRGIGMGYTEFLLLEDFDHGRHTHQKVMADSVDCLGPTNLIVSQKTSGVDEDGYSWVEYIKRQS